MRKIKLIQAVTLVFCGITMNFLLLIPPSYAIEASFTDPENDIWRVVSDGTQKIEQGVVGSHDEIDITKLEIQGQRINLTFAGNTSTWEHDIYPCVPVCNDTYADIFLTENASVEYNPGDFQGPGYIIRCRNWSEYYNYPNLGVGVFLLYKPNRESYITYIWNGTNWIESYSNLDSARSIGNFSEHVIQIEIPLDAFEITESFAFYAFSSHIYFEDGHFYICMDYFPQLLPQTDIPGFPLSILFLVLAGVYIFIIIRFYRGKN